MTSPLITRRTVVVGMIAGGAATLLASCSAPVAIAPSATPSRSARAITVKDQRGKTLTFEAPVTSIATIPQPLASMVIAVDATAAHLVAMHNTSWLAMKGGIMGEMFPDALTVEHDIADPSFIPNVESIVALNPDVVVQWSDEPLTAPLESAGLTVIGLQNTGTQQDVDEWISILARILGKPERALAMKARSAKALIQVTAATSARTGKAPSILYFNRFTGGLKVAGAETYNDFYIKLVGGTNPATGPTGLVGSGMVGVDVEQVLAWDPDIMLLGNFDAAMPDDIYDNPSFSGASAVRNRRVYKVPLGGYRWDPPSQESSLMWHWLSDIAHPRSGRSTIRAAIVSDYEFLYAHRPTAAQIDTILWTDVNSGSENYTQFHAS